MVQYRLKGTASMDHSWASQVPGQRFDVFISAHALVQPSERWRPSAPDTGSTKNTSGSSFGGYDVLWCFLEEARWPFFLQKERDLFSGRNKQQKKRKHNIQEKKKKKKQTTKEEKQLRFFQGRRCLPHRNLLTV